MKTAQIPGLGKTALLRRKWFVEVVSVGPPLVAALFATWTAQQRGDPWEILLAGSVWLGVASVVKVLNAREQDKDAAARRDHDGLRAALHVIHAVICAANDIPAEEGKQVRVTFHRVVPPVEDAEHIEQLIPYIGGLGGGAGRTFSIRSGITGAAIRAKTPFFSVRENDNESAYVKELKEAPD